MEYTDLVLDVSSTLLDGEEPQPQPQPQDAKSQTDEQQPSSSTRTVGTTTSDSISTLTPGLIQHGQSLKLAKALIDGASNASVDREANVQKLRAFTCKAVGREHFGPGSGHDSSPEQANEALLSRLSHLVRSNERNLAEQLGLFLQVDELRLWEKAGCRDCIHWMDVTFGINRNVALEKLRVARALRSLPVIEFLFATAKLSWSKIRELTRVANAENEQELAAAALDLSSSETQELCSRWRHRGGAASLEGASSGSVDDEEASYALLAFENRALSWRQLNDYSTRITLDLPVEFAAEFLKSLEAQEDILREEGATKSARDHWRESDDAEQGKGKGDGSGKEAGCVSPALQQTTAGQSDRTEQEPQCTKPSSTTPRQRRADAAVMMSAKALAHLGEPIASADRYRVFINLDARVLADDQGYEVASSAHATDSSTVSSVNISTELPPERPCIAGHGPIAAATARRLASQARLTVVAAGCEGGVVATGKETRLFSPTTVRAITARDRCCQMPGCTNTRWLHAHHIVPWAEGGATSIDNGCLVCSSCHRRLHEGGLRLEPVNFESVELSDCDVLNLTVTEQIRAKRMCAQIQRFRLVNPDGSILAGPARRGESSGVSGRTSGCATGHESACASGDSLGHSSGHSSDCISKPAAEISLPAANSSKSIEAPFSCENDHSEHGPFPDTLSQYRVASLQ